MPVPANDAQLRQTAEESVGRWIDTTMKASDLTWDNPLALDALLAGIDDADRRAWWRTEIHAYAHELAHPLHEMGHKRRLEAIGEAYAAITRWDPRPTDRDVARRTPELETRLFAVATGTALAREMAAVAEAVDRAVHELAARAVRLEALRAEQAGYRPDPNTPGLPPGTPR